MARLPQMESGNKTDHLKSRMCLKVGTPYKYRYPTLVGVHQEFTGTFREVCNNKGQSRRKVLIHWILNAKVAYSEGVLEGVTQQSA